MKHNHVIGPVPVTMASEAKTQIEKQGWEVEHICFGGMVVVGQSVLTIKKDQVPPQPGFAFFCAKEVQEGETPVLPEIKIGVPQ